LGHGRERLDQGLDDEPAPMVGRQVQGATDLGLGEQRVEARLGDGDEQLLDRVVYVQPERMVAVDEQQVAGGGFDRAPRCVATPRPAIGRVRK
jgi:hypothetical protein